MYKLSHDCSLEDRLLKLLYAVFGGKQGVEVGGDALPGLLEVSGGLGAGEGVEQGSDKGLVGFEAGALLLFQLVTEGHQFVDFGDYALLFFGRWKSDDKSSYLFPGDVLHGTASSACYSRIIRT